MCADQAIRREGRRRAQEHKSRRRPCSALWFTPFASFPLPHETVSPFVGLRPPKSDRCTLALALAVPVPVTLVASPCRNSSAQPSTTRWPSA